MNQFLLDLALGISLELFRDEDGILSALRGGGRSLRRAQ
jgi:hypothetical protein